jgi:hypothetical protein
MRRTIIQKRNKRMEFRAHAFIPHNRWRHRRHLVILPGYFSHWEHQTAGAQIIAKPDEVSGTRPMLNHVKNGDYS